MTDPSRPSWPSPDDADDAGGAGRSSRPPPPPAPDLTRGAGRGLGHGDEPWATPGEPDGGMPAPPSWPTADDSKPRKKRSARIRILVAVVVLVVGGALVARIGDGPDDAPGVAVEDPAVDQAPDDPADDGDFVPEVARAHRQLFTAIDASERTMIELSEATPAASTDLDDELAEFQAEAGEHVAELERLHGEIESLDAAGSTEVERIRDAYLTHLSDWIDWGRTVASDPSIVDRPDAAQPYFDAINFSADGFSGAVEQHLDRGAAPDDVVDLADEIIDRGFDSGEDDGTEI